MSRGLDSCLHLLRLTSASFYFNLPLDGLALAIIIIFLDIKTPRTPVIQGLKALDWLGALLIIGGTLMFLFGLNYGGQAFPWSGPPRMSSAFALTLRRKLGHRHLSARLWSRRYRHLLSSRVEGCQISHNTTAPLPEQYQLSMLRGMLLSRLRLHRRAILSSSLLPRSPGCNAHPLGRVPPSPRSGDGGRSHGHWRPYRGDWKCQVAQLHWTSIDGAGFRLVYQS